MSTRSFYRHFESKQALHVALLRREIASVVRRLTRAVESTDDPVAGVERWIDAFLETFFDPALASRSAAFTRGAAMAASPLTEQMGQIRDELCQPLADALRRGHESAVLTSPDPDHDARSVYGLVTATAAQAEGVDRAKARAQVIRFAWPALGL